VSNLLLFFSGLLLALLAVWTLRVEVPVIDIYGSFVFEDSLFPFWLSLYASVLPLLIEIACCHFVKDQLFPFRFGICSYVILQISTLSFLAEIRSFVLLPISTLSFLAEIRLSILLQISTLSFLAKIHSSVSLQISTLSFLVEICWSVLLQTSTPSFLVCTLLLCTSTL